MKDVTIYLRARPEQLALINQAAALLKKTRSDFILEVALEHAHAVIPDKALFKLDSVELDAFTVLIDAPIHPNLGIERLRAVVPPWEDTTAATMSSWPLR
jgi:uncharacterized protein (DUF1778 family)